MAQFEVGEWVMATQFAACHQAVNDGSPFRSGFTASKEVVLAADDHHSQGSFREIIVDAQTRIAGVPN